MKDDAGDSAEWSKLSGLVTTLPWGTDLALPVPGSFITIAGADEDGTTISRTFTIAEAERSEREGWIDVRLEEPGPE